MPKVAIIMPVYNMGERADCIARFIRDRVKHDYRLIVVDNGSYMHKPRCATHRLETNIGAGGGWMYGIDQARKLGEHDYYWLLSTSTQFDEPNIHGDPFAILLEHFKNDPDCIAAKAGWKGAQVWTHKRNEWKPECYKTDLISNALWDARWWDRVGGYDRRLTHGCGSDMELAYKARQEGKTLWVCSDVPMIISEGVIYSQQRSPISRDEYVRSANRQMCDVFSEKYGENWVDVLLEGIPHPEWRPWENA